jgi:hypothetical protein
MIAAAIAALLAAAITVAVRIVIENLTVSSPSQPPLARPPGAGISRKTCYKQSMTLADLNGLSPADPNATPWVRRRTDHGPAWSAPASTRTSRRRPKRAS